MNALRTCLLCAGLMATPAFGQTSGWAATNQFPSLQAAEAMRADCIQGRRMICGRILKVLPGGLIIDSGYTNLMRHPVDRSWLITGRVEAQREPDLLEKNEPDCVCAGLVYVTDLPKSRRARLKVFDYVVLQGFPAGHFTYDSVGTLERTVRRFSASLPIAVKLNLAVK